jgi:hypothetical protein
VNNYFLKFFIFCMLTCVLLLSSCQPSQSKDGYQESEHVRIAHRLRGRALKRIQRKYDLRLAAIGGGMNGSINMVTLWFDHDGLLSRDESRLMVVDATEILLEEFNKNEEVRPYLIHYPLESQNVNISIHIQDGSERSPFHPQIAVATSLHGRVEYRTYSPEKEYGYFEIIEEPYWEAKAIAFGKQVPKEPELIVER